MRRIEETFQRLRQRKAAALIGFIVGGDPSPEASLGVVKALIRGGVDIVELGIPFSDPIADGPTIQAASLRALKAGTNPAGILNLAKSIREESDLPIVLLTYFNPIFRMGVERFAEEAIRAGVDGLVVPDLPVEEAGSYRTTMVQHGLDTIFLAAPSTSPKRLEKITQATSGFLYLVSLYGVTGVRESLERSTIELVRRFADSIGRRVPLAVGFGISRREHVESLVRNGADGIIVGSAFVRTLQEHPENIDDALNRLEVQASALKKGTLVA